MAMIFEYNRVEDFTKEFESGKLKQYIYKYILEHKEEERNFNNNNVDIIDNMNRDNIYDFFELIFYDGKGNSCEDLNNYPKDNLCAEILHKLIKECYKIYEKENQIHSVTLSSDMDILQTYLKLRTILDDSALKKGICLYQAMSMNFSRKEAEDIYDISLRAYMKTNISVSLENIVYLACNAINEHHYSIEDIDQLNSHDFIEAIYTDGLEYFMDTDIEKAEKDFEIE